MVQKRLTIDYQEYASMAEMAEADRSLLERAVKATEGSYAPYSKYNVGAAVLLSDGTVVTGANQENAAFPSGLCAERTALFAAHAQYPRLAVRAIAITACRDGRMVPEPAWPCGACRQVLAESQRVPEKSRGPRPCHRGRPQPYCSIFLCGGYSAVYLQRTIGRKGRRQRDSAHLHRKA